MSVDWQNGFEATLSDRVIPTDTYIKLSKVPRDQDDNIIQEGRLVLEDNSSDNFEIIHYTSADTLGVYVADVATDRNQDGNSSGTHPRNARVRMNITAQDMREIRDYSKTIADQYSALPTGTVLPYAGSTAPSLFLIADGTAVSRSDYADLFGVIGTTYGAGDGTLTFNLPDLRGRVAVGRDPSQTEFDILNDKGGEKTHKLTDAEMPSHYHSANPPSATTSSNGNHNHGTNTVGEDGGSLSGSTNKYRVTGGGSTLDTTYDGTHSHTVNIGAFNTSSAGSDAAHNNLQPYITLNHIIRT